MKALGILALVALAGCFDPLPPSTSTVNGTYTLKTLNGAALPATWTARGTDIVADTIIIYSTGTYTQSGTFRTPPGSASATTQSAAGVYGLQGTSITFSPVGAPQRVAVISGTNMTFVESGATLVYSK